MKPFLVSRIGISLLIFVIAAVSAASARSKAQATKDPAPAPASAKSTSTKTKAPAPTPAPAPSPSGTTKTIGNPNAPITMEVFGDFQCPACRNFFETTVKQVIDDYVVPEKVYLIHRDFPLQMHPYALQAARLANAAADCGQFEAMERALYDHQDEWSTKGNIDEVVSASFAPAQFKKFQSYGAQHLTEINASIERDRMMGVQRNVNQTPTIFVTSHGKTEALPGGGVDYKLLKNYFEYLLRQ